MVLLMLKYCQGDIFVSEAEAVVNTVNCVGVMGRGIALQSKKCFPENFKFYQAACKRGEVVPGEMLVFPLGRLLNPRYVINFPTKKHWRQPSRMEYIVSGLQDLLRVIKDLGIKTIAVPPLGCGLGGLDWETVRSKMEDAFASLPEVNVEVYTPTAVQIPRERYVADKRPNMTPVRAAVIGLMREYLSGMMEPFITLLELQKLLYFLQLSGEKLHLIYGKYIYGPYTFNLRHILTAIEGHFVSGYGPGGDDPDKVLEILPGAVGEAEVVLSQSPCTQERMRRVGMLISGFETPYGMELLATVHWAATHNTNGTLEEVIQAVHDWNDRKKQFTSMEIATALERLRSQNWL